MSSIKLNAVAEEFNKYLSYVRNLGFEDTPDYDYLRELFTQALKNTGDIEDGEYDWMKLNNGKGWEAMKHHTSQHLHAPNGPPNASARALAGGTDTPRGPGTPGVTALRLNAAQPLPPSPAKPPVDKSRRPGAPGTPLPKRQSGAAGALTDVVTPTASTQAQFQNSNAHLPNRTSQANLGAGQNANAQSGARQQNPEQQASAMQKIMKVFCCGR